YPQLMRILELKVKPERARQKREDLVKRWWQFAYRKHELYLRSARLGRLIAGARVTPHVCFAFQPTNTVFNEKVNVFIFDDLATFGVLNSRVHETWVRCFTSSLGETLNYSITDSFDNFPRPAEDDLAIAVANIAEAYNGHRSRVMEVANEGMTKTYNRFHDS